MLKSRKLQILNSTLCLLVITLCLSVNIRSGIGLYVVRAVGESMEPSLPRDALLLLEERKPSIGDIVHVENEDFNIAHRVVDLEGNVVTTRGDNCPGWETADADDVRGVVLFALPFQLFMLAAVLVIGLESYLAVAWASIAIDNRRNRMIPEDNQVTSI